MKDTIKSIDILLVEDSEGDIRLIQEALKDGKLDNTLYVARDGVEAMDFLLKRGKFKGSNRPELILLDLNLPKMDGREVLEKLKLEEDLKRIPVIILSTSNNDADVIKTYDLHANCYIVKPLDLDKFLSVVRSIETFWLTIVKLPEKEN